MKIGLTYDLRDDYIKCGYTSEEAAEFDTEETILGIQGALEELGYETERMGGFRQLISALQEGKRPDMIFNICEGMYGIGREAQVPALLDAYRIPYTFSDAAVLSVALHKGLTKRIVKELGVATPDFAIIECPEDIGDIKLSYPLFVKPVAEGTGKGIRGSSIIHAQETLESICGEMLIKYKQPVLVEEYLPGREFTIGIVGTGRNARAIGAMEIVFVKDETRNIYSFESKSNYESLVEYRRADDGILSMLEKDALKIWRGLGCRDAGRMDFRMDRSGRLNFLEVNPLAGLNPVHSDLPIICGIYGISFKELIRLIMDSALERTGM